eukprot:GHVS01100687.1.p1 GENE.GHVS01100687.1~~GHVS01100687.1.p1  ORF type:complete len:138 (+),score=26.29 GHVS01100687.1:152-565(+)
MKNLAMMHFVAVVVVVVVVVFRWALWKLWNLFGHFWNVFTSELIFLQLRCSLLSSILDSFLKLAALHDKHDTNNTSNLNIKKDNVNTPMQLQSIPPDGTNNTTSGVATGDVSTRGHINRLSITGKYRQHTSQAALRS